MSQAASTPAIRLRRDHRILARDGTALAVTQWSGRAVTGTAVFLHGLCLSRTAWNTHIDDVLRRFGATTQILSYDHRGHGDSASASASTYRIDTLADDLDQVLTALGITGPVTLIGHSLGAMVALTYLASPERSCAAEVNGLVLCATAAGRLPEQGLGRLLVTPALRGLVEVVDHVPTSAAALLTTPLRIALDRTRTRGGIQRQTLTAVTANALATTPLRTAVGFLPSLRDYDQHHSLGDITAHTTILSGGMDVLTPRAHAEAMARAIPGAAHVHLPAAGHMLPQQEPRAVADAIAATISAASPAAATSLPVAS